MVVVLQSVDLPFADVFLYKIMQVIIISCYLVFGSNVVLFSVFFVLPFPCLQKQSLVTCLYVHLQFIQQAIRRDFNNVDEILNPPEGQDEGVWKYEHLRSCLHCKVFLHFLFCCCIFLCQKLDKYLSVYNLCKMKFSFVFLVMNHPMFHFISSPPK